MPVAHNSRMERRQRLWDSLKAMDPPCDAMLITSPHNVRYLTGFTGSNGLAIVTAFETLFFTDPRYTFQSNREVGGGGTRTRIRVVKTSLLEHAAGLLQKRKWRRVGIEQDHLTASQLQTLLSKGSKRQELVHRGGEVEKLRMVK